MGRNFGFAQILSFLYLLRNNFKSFQIQQLKTSPSIVNRFLLDFEISKFFKINSVSAIKPDRFFYQHVSFFNRLNLFLLYMNKISPDLRTANILRKLNFISRNTNLLRKKFMPQISVTSSEWSNSVLAQHVFHSRTLFNKKFPTNYRLKFVQLGVLKLPDKLINEFQYHNFLRQRDFKSLQTFRFNSELISPAFLYDKQFDHEFSFFPSTSRFALSSITSNLFSLFYMNDRLFFFDLQLFRSVFSRKNLHFFYPDLDSSSNFRGKFLKISPLFRFFYLKRERFKYIFSYNFLNEISPFIFSIAINWLTYYRLLRVLLLAISKSYSNSWFVFRGMLPRFSLSFVFLNLDSLNLMFSFLKNFFFLNIFFFFLMLYFFSDDLFIFIIYIFFFFYNIFRFLLLFRIRRIELLFSYFRPFSFQNFLPYLSAFFSYFFFLFFPNISYRSFFFRSLIIKSKFFFKFLVFLIMFLFFYCFKIFMLIDNYSLFFIFILDDVFFYNFDLNLYYRLVIKFSVSWLFFLSFFFFVSLNVIIKMFKTNLLLLSFYLIGKFLNFILFKKMKFFSAGSLMKELDLLIKISEFELQFIRDKFKKKN